MIPYGRQSINEDDIRAVESVLRSDWLTQGPKVEEFETALANYCGARFAVVTANGTAALHAAYAAAGLTAGDELLTSPMTFPATSTAALWQGARPIFVDIDSTTGNIDATALEQAITKRTKVIAPIDYTGRPVELATIKAIAKKHNLVVVEDACQALGATYHGQKIGAISDLTVFSFHPVKTITTGEGGAVLTNNEAYYRFMKKFVVHGMVKSGFKNTAPGPWYFEITTRGQNYRLTDMQCALGISQLRRVDTFVAKRLALANRYRELLAGEEKLRLPEADTATSTSAWHLFVVRLAPAYTAQRQLVVEALRHQGVGAQVHHIPVYLHPYYQELGYSEGQCPQAELWYQSIVSLPLYPDLSLAEQDTVVAVLKNILATL